MNPPNPYIDFTTVRAYLFSEDGRITTHSQGLLLGRRVCSMIDRGANVSVVLDGVSTFRGPAVQSMLAEVFSTFGVDHANQKLVFVMDPVPEYANQFALHVREAAASFRELEQGMGPQPVVGEAFNPGSGPEILTILPRRAAEEVREAGAINFGVRPGVASVKPEIAEALADAAKRPVNYIDKVQAAREKRLAAEAEEAARIKGEKSQEPVTYEVDLDEKERVSERKEFERWSSGICPKARDAIASAAWNAWQMRAALQRSEVEYWVAQTKGARRDKWIALVMAGIFCAGLCAMVFFWRK